MPRTYLVTIKEDPGIPAADVAEEIHELLEKDFGDIDVKPWSAHSKSPSTFGGLLPQKPKEQTQQ